MKFERLYTKSDTPVENQIKWKKTNALITDKNNNIIFEMKNIEVPSQFSQTATNIIAQKYFRKAGVPNILTPKIVLAQSENYENELKNLPQWLWPNVPAENAPGFELSSETSAKQVFHRLAGCWTYWGWKEGIFFNPNANLNNENMARIFYDEMYYILAMQIGAPNSPQWFNTGLFWAYGIAGPDSGQWTIDYHMPHDHLSEHDGITPIPPPVIRTKNSYERPQPHACFIQPVSDDLVNPGGIMDLWTREVRLFKHGSGTGTNFSKLRGKNELLSGGGKSSGLMSFLRIGDAAAGATQSGGVTRRAAKMVCLDLDHPEIEDFIDWKMKEERKARAMSFGSKLLSLGGEIYDETESNRKNNNFRKSIR